MNRQVLVVAAAILAASGACSRKSEPSPSGPGTPTLPKTIAIHPGEGATTSDGLKLTSGGDTDTMVVSVGAPAVAAVRTGNGAALPSSDSNAVGDHYAQFQFPDALVFEGHPTTSVVVDVEYWDSGTDAFRLEYDSTAGPFKATRRVFKTDTGRLETARFVLADVHFGNRDNGADLRVNDLGDGAETIRTVTFTAYPAPRRIPVDGCGANPFDDLPDSDAIQACIDTAGTGDVVVFTPAGGNPAYRGYLVDRTVFLVSGSPARSRLTFTSADPADRPLLRASAGLKGFVVRLYARSSGVDPGGIDDVTVEHLHIDGDRAERFCYGPDGAFGTDDDNWGSEVGECGVVGDAWCLPGSLAMAGAFAWDDPAQDFHGHPAAWSTGLLVDDVEITNTTCGTALGMNGADSAISRTAVVTAGDHVHATGCALVKPTEPSGAWSDGFTVDGPAIQIVDDSVTDASDVGIVLFGGHETVVAGNLVHATAGNHGMFAGIAQHAWTYGEVGSGLVAHNVVTNEGDSTCGGIHAGIDLGPHMWGGACASNNPAAAGLAVGSGACPDEPTAPAGAWCPASGRCQEWASVPDTAPFQLTDNHVTGAHINFLVEGLDASAGALVALDNVSTTPGDTDWQAAADCGGVTWGPTGFVAHHPALTGWTDVRVHCER